MQRLKSFDQYKSLNSEESKAKSDDLMPQPVKKEAAPVFNADEMKGINVVGNEVRVPTPQPETKKED
jgi:hypothetical protein